jgi:glycosyltransferase involved in cell wall biosynthesis
MPAVQGYGIPAIESLSRGIPVLLHRESGVSDILQSTPWATVMEGGEEAMVPALAKAIEGVREGRQLAVPLPELPTEDSWAERVVRLCGWV